MDDGRGERLQRVAQAILRYLAEHPDAADNELGIAEWWLPPLGVDASVDEVRAALEQLQRAGQVDALAMANGQRLWRGAQDMTKREAD